jgi:hypothetical protein
MTRDPWRRRCPRGHASLVTHIDKDSYRCQACEQTYDGEPIDAANAGAWQ